VASSEEADRHMADVSRLKFLDKVTYWCNQAQLKRSGFVFVGQVLTVPKGTSFPTAM
jgi:hypothetical protein